MVLWVVIEGGRMNGCSGGEAFLGGVLALAVMLMSVINIAVTHICKEQIFCKQFFLFINL
jgi:hypothetical protein